MEVTVEQVPQLQRRNTGGSVYRRQNSQSFLQESYSTSIDFPAYIPWQTLSTNVNDQLRHGSIIINRSNCLEWASPIKEENERLPLLDKKLSTSRGLPVIEEPEASSEVGISWQVSSFLLVNCALGAGIINYPAAYDHIGGVVIASFVQLALLFILFPTMLILVYASDYNFDNTYHDVVHSMCGKRYQQLAAVSILLSCYGICVAFLIIMGDQFDRLALVFFSECHWYVDRRATIAMTAIFFVLPMCYFRRLDFLRFASTLGVFSIIYLSFICVYQYFYLEKKDVQLRTSPRSTLTFLATIPVFTFAYQFHEIVINVYSCMKKRSIKNFTKSTILALAILFVVYSVTGTAGYLTFGLDVTADIMLRYDASDPVVMIGVIALIIKMITTYPLITICGRGALDGLYAEFAKLSADKVISGERKRHAIITTGWFITSLALAVSIPNIGIVIEFLGSLASVNVFFFPSLCLIAIVKREEKLRRSVKILFVIISLLLILFGIVVFFLVIIQIYHELKYDIAPKHVVLCKD